MRVLVVNAGPSERSDPHLNGSHDLAHAWVAHRVPVLLTRRRQLAPGPSGRELRIVSCHLGAGASLCAIRDLHALAALEQEPGAECADMRELLDRAERGEHDAALALGVYVRTLREGIAAMAAALGGLDALAFSGGVGERTAEIRRLAAEGLGFLGVELDAKLNERANGDGAAGPQGANAVDDDCGDCDISREDARVRTFVVQAREES